MPTFTQKNLFFFMMISIAFMISKSEADNGGLIPAGGRKGPRIKGCYNKDLCDAKGSNNVLLLDTTNCYNSGQGAIYACGTFVGCNDASDPNLSGCPGTSVHNCKDKCQGQDSGSCCISKVWDD